VKNVIGSRTVCLALLSALMVAAAACGNGRASSTACPEGAGSAACGQGSTPSAGSKVSAARLPRLVDVGAGKCIPCKAMAPILAQLRSDLAGRIEVEFVDAWVNPDAVTPYGIRLIPTQIFYAADGRELSRHEGFMSREEILARWRSHGVGL
jgi:thioredoxin 1